MLRKIKTRLKLVGIGFLLPLAASAQITQAQMERIYETVKTPYKYGLVVAPSDNYHKFDCPTVFRHDGRWYMTYVCYDGKDGTDGVDGKDGTSIRTGNGSPSNGLGNDGDSYINLDNWDYYVKENGSWVLKGNIKGSDGVNGKTVKTVKMAKMPFNIFPQYSITMTDPCFIPSFMRKGATSFMMDQNQKEKDMLTMVSIMLMNSLAGINL